MALNVRLERLKFVLEQLCGFIEPYKRLLNTHNLEFLAESHWYKFIGKNNPFAESLIDIIEKHGTILTFYYKEVDLCQSDNYMVNFLHSLKDINHLWNSEVVSDLNKVKIHNCTDEELKEIKDEYFKNSQIKSSKVLMKEKKKHEVDEMSYLVADLCKNLKLNMIIDIGSGRGYLCTQLSSIFKFNVIGIDSKQSNLDSSTERIEIMKKNINLDLDQDGFKTFNEFIKLDTNLTELINKRLNIDLSKTNYAIVGLHSCGNLSNSMIDIYLRNSNNAHLLCNVACCYHLIDEKYAPDEYCYISEEHKENCSNEANKMQTFPMSSGLNESKYYLGRNARILATLPIDRYAHNEKIKNHGIWFRCVLEVILKDKYNLADDAYIKIGKLAKKHDNFNNFVRKALEKLNIENVSISDEEIDNYWKKYEPDQKYFNYFYQFKILFAPLIEYIILLDRLIYLMENRPDLNNYIVQLFEPIKSPRCFGLISYAN